MSNAEFDQLFRTYYKALMLFAEKLQGDRALAEDAVSDTMERLLMRTDLTDIKNPAAFLYQSVRNACLDQKRKSTLHGRHHQKLAHTIIIQEERILADMFFAETYRELVLAVETLPERSKKVIKMTYMEGLPSHEIAGQLDITLSTVRSLRARGIVLLRNILSKGALLMAISLMASQQSY